MSTWKKAVAYRKLADGRIQVKTTGSATKRANPARKRATTKRATTKRKKRTKNVAMGYFDAHGFHPIRSSSDYDESRVGETSSYSRKTKRKATASRASKLAKNRARAGGPLPKLNPARKKKRKVSAALLAILAKGRAKRMANLRAAKRNR